MVACENCGKKMPKHSLLYYHSLKCFPVANPIKEEEPEEAPLPPPPQLTRTETRAVAFEERTNARKERLSNLIQSALPKQKNKS
jgi:hypothetical protein